VSVVEGYRRGMVEGPVGTHRRASGLPRLSGPPKPPEEGGGGILRRETNAAVAGSRHKRCHGVPAVAVNPSSSPIPVPLEPLHV
jgi:hypothetical protein